jgi:chromosome segregation ATPase
VADFIAAQQRAGGGCAPQYLVVSHRPQVYERAGCLVGVYSRGRASHAVTLHAGSEGQGGAWGR